MDWNVELVSKPANSAKFGLPNLRNCGTVICPKPNLDALAGFKSGTCSNRFFVLKNRNLRTMILPQIRTQFSAIFAFFELGGHFLFTVGDLIQHVTLSAIRESTVKFLSRFEFLSREILTGYARSFEEARMQRQYIASKHMVKIA